MERYDRDYGRSRNYRSNNRGRTRGRNRSYNSRHTNQSGGGGFTFIMLLLMIVAGAYFLSGEEGKDTFNEWIGKAKVAVSEFITPTEEVAATPLPSDMTPCTKANIAKIVAYTFLEGETIEDTTGEDKLWYSKYYEYLKKDPKFASFDEAEAMEVMTYNEAKQFFSDLLGDGVGVEVTSDREVGNEPLTLKEFLKGFEQALEHAGKKDLLKYEDLSILATTSTHEAVGPWQVLTDKGVYGFEGLILDPFIGYTLQAVVKGDEILGIVDTLSLEGKIGECYIESVGSGQATVKVGDYTLTYENQVVTENEVGKICNVVLQDHAIVRCEMVKEDDTDTLLRMTESYVEFEKGGCLPFAQLAVYDGIGQDFYKNTSQLFSGIKVTYTMQDGMVQTIKVVDDHLANSIRVLISEDGIGTYSHDQVIVGSDADYTLIYGDQVKGFLAGQVFNADEFAWEIGKNKVTLIASEEKSLEMQGITRQDQHPLYKGQLEIYKEEEGYTVVNSLNLEDYLAAVIPSEMPTDYGLEAVKAQAIAARSFAKSHQKSNKYIKYGAQLDDTVSTQVYNNVPANAISYEAAKSTEGEVMVFNDRIISGNFFSTSCGYTANHGETWAVGEIFPNSTPSYLVARQQYIGERAVNDMTDEKEAYKFLTKSAKEIDAFDKDSPWFRWQLTLDAAELEHVVNSNLYNLTTHYANMVKVKDGDKWVIGEINNMGKVKDIQITKRGEGGNIMELIVVGEECTIKVGTEYLIRMLFAPIQKDSTKDPIVIVRQDGSEIQNMALLPSAFFSPDIRYDDKGLISKVTFYGGGYGHGVGMSQNGAKGMASRGYTCKEILRHYYSGVEIKKM